MSNLEPKKYFSLKKPCTDCPFRSDKEFPLSVERKADIAESLKNGQEFVCHRTVDYLDDDASDQSHSCSCAGARETSRRSGIVSNAEQFAQRFGFEFSAVDTDSPVYDSLDEWVKSSDKN